MRRFHSFVSQFSLTTIDFALNICVIRVIEILRYPGSIGLDEELKPLRSFVICPDRISRILSFTSLPSLPPTHSLQGCNSLGTTTTDLVLWPLFLDMAK